jgi:hypothetical protein
MQDPVTGHMHSITEALAVELSNDGKTCVLRIGEVVEIKHGHFRVAAIGKRFIRLEGIPGTVVRRGKET